MSFSWLDHAGLKRRLYLGSILTCPKTFVFKPRVQNEKKLGVGEGVKVNCLLRLKVNKYYSKNFVVVEP